jgi:hypothetical protein
LPEFIAPPAYEIARRAELRGAYAWFVVLEPAVNPDEALQEFQHELSAYLEKPARILDASGLSVGDLRRQLHEPSHDTVVLVGLDAWNQGSWSSLDINRDGMERAGPLIFWVSSTAASVLCQFAPNIRSFIGGSIFLLGVDRGLMSEEERHRRLEELASHYQLDNEQVIRMAQARTLPREPEFIEWLVLLGRGDLV